ncbi:MAG: hypothetical protein IKC48_04885 [Clostridia bacterium]|nr:hypothetical protein [Clostridia bacterium]
MSNNKGRHDGHRERLRQAAYMDPDLSSFSDYQTLEFLLSFTIPRKDTNEIAHELLERFGSMDAVFKASPAELFDVPNMTQNASYLISYFNSIHRKILISKAKETRTMTSYAQAKRILSPYFADLPIENVYMATLDINNKVMSIVKVNSGYVDSSPFDISKVVSVATSIKAKEIVVAHNHPGGNPQPSAQDRTLTSVLYMTLSAMNIELADHLIFAGDSAYSFFIHGNFDGNAERVYTRETCIALEKCRQQGIYLCEAPVRIAENEEE